MCGIVGFIDHRSEKEKEPIINQMMDSIIHRGPISCGQYVDDYAALGFRRLSIIDLECGNQPLYNEKRNKILTFNGEIYNHKELRKELIDQGYQFTTDTDSEVLIHGYDAYGKDLLQKLRGMFAFVIWDKDKQELFGARDHFGIKPLFYTQMGESFLYASELKALLRHPDFVKEFNNRALKPYMTFEYSGLKETFFKNVYRLEEGHYFTYSNGKLETHQYWDANLRESDMTFDEAVDLIEEAVIESVEAHKVSDVEVGTFLSSGVDSSFVASVLKPKHSYSIGFGDHTYNETVEAEALAEQLNIENKSRILSGSEAFEAFPEIQYYLDEPDANPSLVPLYFLSELASRDLRVVMSGEGADELFGGYITYGYHSDSYAVRRITEGFKKLPQSIRYNFSGIMDRLPNFKGKMHLHAALKDPSTHFSGHSWIFGDDEASEFLKADYQESTPIQEIVKPYYDKVKHLSNIKQMEYVDLHHWMPKNILLKADRMSMAHSLELRTPLLDIRLMELAERIPTEYQINANGTKQAFREAAKRHLPEEWAKRPKLGFPVPIKEWLREPQFHAHVKEAFKKDFVQLFFDQEKIMQLLEDNFNKKIDAQRKVWTIYTFIIWYEIYFINDGRKPNKQTY